MQCQGGGQGTKRAEAGLHLVVEETLSDVVGVGDMKIHSNGGIPANGAVDERGGSLAHQLERQLERHLLALFPFDFRFPTKLEFLAPVIALAVIVKAAAIAKARGNVVIDGASN